MTLTWRHLVAFAGVSWLAGCGPKAINEPPPQTAASAPTPADAGLPAVPLERKGVAVPSDVKLQPAPPPVAPNSSAPETPAAPGGN